MEYLSSVVVVILPACVRRPDGMAMDGVVGRPTLAESGHETGSVDGL